MNFHNHHILGFLAIALVARREFFIRQRSFVEYSSIDLHAMIEIGIVGATFLFILVRSELLQTSTKLMKTSMLPLACYFIFAVAFSPLSQNSAYSIFFAGEYFSQVLLIFCIIASSPTHESAVKRLITLSLIATYLTIGFSLSRLGISGQLFDYKHNVGGACGAMLGVYCLVYFISEKYSANLKRTIWFGMVGGLGAVVLTTSAASIISTMFGVALASLVAGKGKAPLFILIAVLTVGAFIYPDKAFEIVFPGKDLAQVESLHGRTQFWDDAVLLLTEKPFVGYGYAMAAKVGNLQSTNLHNSMLSLIIGTGIVGSFIFLIGLGQCLRENFTLVSKKIPGGVSLLAALATGLLNSNTLSFFGEDWRSASFVFIAIWSIIAFSVYQATYGNQVASQIGSNQL